MSKPVLGYSEYRGFVQQHRHLLQYLGVDYEDKRYGYGPPPECNRDDWWAAKPNLGLAFPNLPYWIDSEIKLTESKAILKYIAQTRGPQLVPKTPQFQAVADMLEGNANDLQQVLVQRIHYPKDEPEAPLGEALADKFNQFNAFFSDRQWVVGDDITYVDFFVYEVLKQFSKLDSEILKPYPALGQYLERFEALPQLSEYLKSIDGLSCYSPRSKVQF